MRCRGAAGLEFMASPAGNKKSGSATLAIRPEKIRLKAGGAHGEIVQSIYIGTDTNYEVRIGDGSGLSVRVQNARRWRQPVHGRRQGGHRRALRRRPHAAGLNGMAEAVIAGSIQTPRTTAKSASARRQAAAENVSRRTRWALIAPALIVIGILGIAPLFIIVIYSFLKPGAYGGVVWEFSTDAYVQFLFEKDLFDESYHFTTSYLQIYSPLPWPCRLYHPRQPDPGLSDRLFHGHAAAASAAISGSS